MASHHVGAHKGDHAGRKSEPAFSVTAGNIMTPVDAFSKGITSGGPFPGPRGYNKSPGEETFPTRSGASKKSNPLGAFGLGGKS